MSIPVRCHVNSGSSAQYEYLSLEESAQLLGLKPKRSGSGYVGCCPVHGGDNPRGFTAYLKRNGEPGFCCHTAGCDWSAIRQLLLERGILRYGRIHAGHDPTPRKKFVSVDTIELAQWRLCVAAADIERGERLTPADRSRLATDLKITADYPQSTHLFRWAAQSYPAVYQAIKDSWK